MTLGFVAPTKAVKCMSEIAISMRTIEGRSHPSILAIDSLPTASLDGKVIDTAFPFGSRETQGAARGFR
jgi:hypothetical protein